MKQEIANKVLSNEERKYFGLEPILPDWDCVEIKNGYYAFFDGDVIRKTISIGTLSGEGFENYLDYGEQDNEIQTRDRAVVLPRTERGKEKKLNYSSVSSMNPTGCSFHMNLTAPNNSAHLHAANFRNSISLPIEFPNELHTLEAFKTWLQTFIAACPANYFEKVERMKTMPHQTIKYFNGDIFSFEVGLEHYGFGIIIGQVKKMKKDGLLKEEHILLNTMGVPLLVRFYQFLSTEKTLPIEEITRHPLGKTLIMMDNSVIWGVYEIVGNKKLEAADIAFPIQSGESISARDSNYVRLCWGTGLLVKRDVSDFPEDLVNNKLMRHACHAGVNRKRFKEELEAKPLSGLDELEKLAFEYFGVPLSTSFDAFNRAHGGMTREEYVVYANKAGRKAKASKAKK